MKMKWIATVCVLLLTTTACTPNMMAKPVQPGNPFIPAFIAPELIGAKDGRYASSEAEKAALDSMTLMLENNRAALYYGEAYADIALYDKYTGHIWFSNRALYIPDETAGASETAASEAYSQLRIRYYDVHTRADSMSSYPDATDGEDFRQIQTEVDGEMLRVIYTIGRRRDNMVVYTALRAETYIRLSEEIERLAEDGMVDSREAAAFENGYSLFSLEDAADEEERAAMLEDYPFLDKHPELYMLDGGLSDLQRERLQTVLQAAGVTGAMIEEEKKHIGMGDTESGDPYFVIPLEYRLDGGDLIAQVPGQDVQCAAGYMLGHIEILPQFAAAPAGSSGYLFVPDGSGAIIHNDTPGMDMYEMYLSFYGSDYGLDLVDGRKVGGSVPLPVYGIQAGNSAVVAVMEDGEANCHIQAEVSNDTAAYNRVKLFYDYHKYDEIRYSWESGVTHLVFAKQPSVANVRVRYHALYADNLSYDDMAVYYRDYLEQTGVLEKMATELGLHLDIAGSTYRYTQFLGFSRKSIAPMTTFEEAQTMLNKLADANMQNVRVSYETWMNGGSSDTIPSNVRPLGQLGGKAGLQALGEAAAGWGYTLSPAVDFTSSARNTLGTGYDSARDAARYISKSPAVAAPYDLVSGKRLEERVRYLTHPHSYAWIADRFLDAYKGLSMPSVTLQRMGSTLGANYSIEYFTDRETTKDYTVDLMKKLSDAGYDLILNGGNLYTLPYASYIGSLPVISSNRRIESHAVPFTAMVLRGYLPYSGDVINVSGDIETEILRTAESGADLHFRMMAADNRLLSEAIDGQTATVSQSVWMQRIIDTYSRYAADFRPLDGQRIVRHQRLDSNVVCVTYENGGTVYINYGDESVQTDGVNVEGRSYMVVS